MLLSSFRLFISKVASAWSCIENIAESSSEIFSKSLELLFNTSFIIYWYSKSLGSEASGVAVSRVLFKDNSVLIFIALSLSESNVEPGKIRSSSASFPLVIENIFFCISSMEFSVNSIACE